MAEDEKVPGTQIVDISGSLDEDLVSAMLDRTVAGKYKIARRLARGGMGVVYVADHVTLGRKVVIKVLSYHLADDQRAKSRFEREARGLSVLDHPNVVTVHDFGIEQGLTYIVMEYIEGENLSQRVRRKGRVPYDELVPIMLQVIDALAAAHEKGIVHRDVKPSNVMVTNRAGRNDFVKVLDFGLAKLATNSVDITKGNLVGTVSYLSPEVIKGGDALPAADVYAMGVMFYYLLSGSKPFQAGDDMSVLYQHVNVDATWLGDLIPEGEAPQEFLEFIHHCMEKDPQKRPIDGQQMKQELGAIVSLPSISAFSLDSSLALPRYHPPDSSAQDIKRPKRITGPVAASSPSLAARPQDDGMSVELSQRSMTRPSIAMARPKPGLRVAVIAFTVFSLGLVGAAFLMRGEPPPAQPPVQPQPQPEPPPAPKVTPTTDAPAMATLSLTTTPQAVVALDGDVKGMSPLKIEISPGEHVVSVSKPGFKPWTQTVDLEAGQRRDIDVFLNRRAPDDPVEVAPPKRPTRSAPKVRKQPVAEPEPAPATNNAPAKDAGQAVTEAPPPEPEPEPKKNPKGLLSVDGKRGGLLPVQD